MGKHRPAKHRERSPEASPEPRELTEAPPVATEAEAAPERHRAAPVNAGEIKMQKREDEQTMPAYAMQTESQHVHRPAEGVTVVGEAVRAITPETAEFVIEISANAPTAAQAVRDNHLKSTQIAQAIAAMGVQPTDLQTISFNVYNLFSSNTPALNPYAGVPQIGLLQPGVLQPGVLQPDVQFGSFQSRKALRVTVRETARIGEIADTASRAGAVIVGGFTFKPSDETAARKAALEAAGKDARAKAETLAAAAGKQLGEAVAISEDVIASNGVYTALRTANPFAFGAGAPQMAGELEYYARVSARFRLQ